MPNCSARNIAIKDDTAKPDPNKLSCFVMNCYAIVRSMFELQLVSSMHVKPALVAALCTRLLACKGLPVVAEDLAFLEMTDIELLNLPTLAESVMTRCIKLGMCQAPLVLDFAAELESPRKPIQVQKLSL